MKVRDLDLKVMYGGVEMVLCEILDQYLSSYQTLTKSIIRCGNNEVLKTLTQNF